LAFVPTLLAGRPAIKPPFHLGMSAIDSAIPSTRFSSKCLQIWNSPTAQALPREHPDFDFRLVEPTSMLGV
jgi:hypothetical protein